VRTRGATLSSGNPPDISECQVAATLDAGSQNCASLILNVREAMKRLMTDEILAVVAYDPSAELDLQAWSRMTGHGYLGKAHHEAFAIYYIRK
jgi:tRNA 2-thiouridine synthesizing protein A